MRLVRTTRTPDGRRHYNVEIGGGNAFAVFDGAELPTAGERQHVNHLALQKLVEAAEGQRAVVLRSAMRRAAGSLAQLRERRPVRDAASKGQHLRLLAGVPVLTAVRAAAA